LTGRVAIVTGAGAGIGAGIAAMLAEAGAAVAVADIDGESAASTAKVIENRGGRAITVNADVSDARDIDAMVRQTVTDLGGVDILVNNAGIATTELVEDLDEEKWRGVLDVNLTGPFLCCKAVLPHMRRKRWGRIVNVASVAAKRISFTGAASYTASKAGLLGFTRHLAYEVAPDGINVNAICPGPTMTPDRPGPQGAMAHPRRPWTRHGVPLLGGRGCPVRARHRCRWRQSAWMDTVGPLHGQAQETLRRR
jgi:NAD(P)-dependent dehydrogenase (short-subunit alcohol dehydrogenase family)